MNVNDFVVYLNSSINVSGDTTGSLAEKQVKSQYFDRIKVERKLGHYIYDKIRAGEHHAFVLTGHAGDGKTSILVQILRALGYLPEGDGLKETDEFSDFFYVKDMSELSEKEALRVLRRALAAPENGKTSLLISNTGPLLKTFTSWREEIGGAGDWDEKEQLQFKSELLTQLDQNKDTEIRLTGLEAFPFYLVNIARLDNISFSTEIFQKMVDDALWEPCAHCDCMAHCPIKHNQNTVARRFGRVSQFVESVYRYLYENDKRMTIRQMVAQLSYGLTGNLSCEDICGEMRKESLFNYNFANLFFGYRGLGEQKEALQIQGIKQLRLLELDHIALDVDYSLFVKQDYSSFFPEEIQEELRDVARRYRGLYRIDTENDSKRTEQMRKEREFRRAVRRYYLVYGLYDRQEKLNQLLNQLFGANFTDYLDLILKESSDWKRRKLQDLVFQALYIKNTGVMPSGNKLYLTLKRGDSSFQNVMLILGETEKRNLKIKQISTENDFEDQEEKKNLYLCVENKRFLLSLPMINYFGLLIDGVISSNENPALTHNIASLDTLLLDEFGYGESEDGEPLEWKVIVNTARGQEIRSFAIDQQQRNITFS